MLADWKTQIAALVLAPFIGIGFVFDFLLRAKDFPELASAMWGVFGFFVGIFLFFLSVTCAAFSAVALGLQERDLRVSGWLRLIAVWFLRVVVGLGCLCLFITAIWVLSESANGFGNSVAPYVQWLKDHAN